MSEFVTRFRVRDVPLSATAGGPGAGTLALITMDNGGDHRKPTTLGPEALADLTDALDRIDERVAAGELSAVGITGKPYFFAAGADLKALSTIADAGTARGIAVLGHTQLRRLGALGVPTFAFVNGLALGGGLEVALHCTYRAVSTAAVVGLPETLLGLVPGWGGATLLPRLVGAPAALQVIVSNPLQQNKTLSGADAVAAGIGDVLLEPADFLAEGLRWAARVLAGEVNVVRTDHTAAPGWQGAVDAARAQLRSRIADTAPAPLRAVDLIELARTTDLDGGFAAEDDALTELIMSDHNRASLYAFDLVQRYARRPAAGIDAGLSRPVAKVGVVGAGLMASQLALLFAQRLDVPVVISDLDEARVERGLALVRDQLAALAAKGRLSADRARRLTSRVTGTVGSAGFADADLVIEAVFEDLDVKRAVFAGLEEHVSPECVLATNTSSLSVTAMADGLLHPERVVGLHFFNPVAVMPLLEVVPGARTDEATLATAFAVGAGLRKTTVRSADSTSFIANRLLGRFMAEVGAVVDHGTPVDVADAAVVGLAPMPPFQLMGLVGPAIALHNNESLHAAFGDRFVVPECLRAVVTAGRPGFYLPAVRGQAPALDPASLALLTVPERAVELTAGEVRTRVLEALADEARRMLDDGVVADPRDLDLAMITGTGFAFHNGGLLPLLDREGISERVTGARFLPPGVASVPPAG